jgi:hypothetical protein
MKMPRSVFVQVVILQTMLLLLLLQAESYKADLQRANSELTSLLRDKSKVGCTWCAMSWHQAEVTHQWCKVTEALQGTSCCLSSCCLHLP